MVEPYPFDDTVSYQLDQEYEDWMDEKPFSSGLPDKTVEDSYPDSSDSCLPSVTTEQILEADLFSGIIQIENQVIKLPITIHNLYAALSNCNGLEFSISSPSRVNAHSTETASLYIRTDEYTLTIANQTDQNIDSDDCRIIGISSLETYTSDMELPSLILPKGFFRGSHYTDICDSYGSPYQQITLGTTLICTWSEFPDTEQVSNTLSNNSLTKRCLSIAFDQTTKDVTGCSYMILQDSYYRNKYSSYSIPLSEEKEDSHIVCTLPDWIKNEVGLFNTPGDIRYAINRYNEVDYFICASYSLIPNEMVHREDHFNSDESIYEWMNHDSTLLNYGSPISTFIKRKNNMLCYGRICCSMYEGIASVFFMPQKTEYAIRVDYSINPVYEKAGSMDESITSDLKLVFETLLSDAEFVSE